MQETEMPRIEDANYTVRYSDAVSCAAEGVNYTVKDADAAAQLEMLNWHLSAGRGGNGYTDRMLPIRSCQQTFYI